MRRSAAVFAGLLLSLTGCKTVGPVSASATLSADPDRQIAYETIRHTLEQEEQNTKVIKTVTVTVNNSTSAATIVDIVPPKNRNPKCLRANANGLPCLPRGETPKNLEGVFWMRGNPLPDYLLSFANTYWTRGKDGPYGYLSTYAPGSFAWKEKVLAKGAKAGDYKYLPEICRVPKDDSTLNKIARFKVAHDPKNFRRPIFEDYADMRRKNAEKVGDAEADDFVNHVWESGQMPLDGGRSVQLLNVANVFYEAKFNEDFTETTVVVFGLAEGPMGAPPVQVGIPEELASFSFAPHFTDKDIYVRKTFIEGVSKFPNYYLLTRIVDGQGKPTRHFAEFLQCVQERSAGKILKVVR